MFPPSSQCTDCTWILCLCPFIWSSQSNGGKALLKTLSFIYLCEVIKYVCVVAFVNKPTKNWPATDVKVRTGNKYTSTHSPPNWQGLTCVSLWHYRRPRLTDGNVHHQDDLCAHDPLVWGRHWSSSCHRIRDWGSSLRWASTSFHPFCSLVVPEVRYCLALTHTEHSSHQIH